MQVLQKPRLVNRHQGAQAHGHGRELPKLGHQLGVGVAGQTFAIHLLAEVEQLLLAQAPFQIGTGIDTWGHMALDVEQIAAMVFVLGVPKVVEACAKHVSQRSE